MYKETLEKIGDAAISKKNLLEESKGKYFVASILAGLYVGLGVFLILTVGGLTNSLGPQFRIMIGLSFGVALSIVIMAGSELFTGNNLIMAAGAANKAVSWTDTIKVWIFSYFGNLVGCILVGVLFVYSNAANVPHNSVAKFIVNLSKLKMNMTPGSLFFRGVLCNILVCLAVLMCIKMKSESGKLIMIFWCLFAFLTTGYEHSIANMAIFTAALMIPHPEAISLGGAIYNLFWVSFGNIVGGGLLGLTYFYLGRSKK